MRYRSSSAALAVLVLMLTGARSAPGQDFDLTISGACPGRIVLAWRGAMPPNPLAICYSHETGTFRLPAGACGGTITGLGPRGLRLVRVIPSRPDGQGRAGGEATAEFCGGYVQLILFTGYSECPVSNVARLP